MNGKTNMNLMEQNGNRMDRNEACWQARAAFRKQQPAGVIASYTQTILFANDLSRLILIVNGNHRYNPHTITLFAEVRPHVMSVHTVTANLEHQ